MAWLYNNTLERMWKDLKKATMVLGQDKRSSGQALIPGPPAQTTKQQALVNPAMNFRVQ
jgi:hypothetical protein